jgi:dolichyl-phosphate-mannose-protein mannosyltransferase
MSGLIEFLARRHRIIALLLALAVGAAGLAWGARNGGGSDSFGYVSQADLWLRGQLQNPQNFVAEYPWPAARHSFAPLGYRAAAGYTIVPVYPPGLPLLMAGGKLIAGQCGMFVMVPMAGALLVFATYSIGRRIDRPVVGLAAAWIVATSPAVVYMTLWPMSDVPAAALWALATMWLLRETRTSLIAAGIAAALAILVRPNLAPLGIVLAACCWWRDWRESGSPAIALRRTLWFASFAALGPIFIVVLNDHLYGSPFSWGYGEVGNAFLVEHVLPNLQRYGTWLVATGTPVTVAGLIALVAPAGLWRTARAQRARWALAAVAIVVWAIYLLYLPFDAWWYLRFLLPAWPGMALGIAALASAIFHARAAWSKPAAILLVAAVGGYGIWYVVARGLVAIPSGEAKFTEVARVVRAATPPDAVIFADLHSGTLRYYGGRMTVRYKAMDTDWLDRAVAWLIDHGHHPYFLVEASEIPYLSAKYGPQNEVARLDWAPIVSFRGGEIRLYDAANRQFHGPTTTASTDPDGHAGCPRPVSLPPEFLPSRSSGQ